MKQRDKSRKYFWVACTHKNDPGCEKCSHAEPHQAQLDGGFSCSGECQKLGVVTICIPTRKMVKE